MCRITLSLRFVVVFLVLKVAVLGLERKNVRDGLAVDVGAVVAVLCILCILGM